VLTVRTFLSSSLTPEVPVLTRLTAAHGLPQQLDNALAGLEAAERATHALTALVPARSAHAYLTARTEAGLALRELLAIPALSYPEETYLSEGGDPAPLVLALTTLADQVARTLMSAANKTRATDRAACLAAAHHTCLLAKALR